MISPKRPIALLPHDRQIMDITGMSEQEYRAFVKHCFNHSKVQPGVPVNFEPVTFIVTLVVGLALSYLASLLAPKPKIPSEQKDPGTKTVNGQNIVRGNEFAPQTGFDAPQNVVELSSIVPLVYASRTRVGDKWYGGVRVNTNLIWSQVMTMANNQMLRAIFLVGEGAPEMSIDPTQFAIGNNLLRSYDLSPGSTTSRLSIYWRNNGGRIKELDNIAGRTYQQDPGNAQNQGADDVYMIRSESDRYKPDFCMAVKPSSQTALGLYGFVGNGFAYKVNPRYRSNRDPIVDTNGELVCEEDNAVNEERRKQRQRWPEYSGLIGNKGLRNVRQGDRLTYLLSSFAKVEIDDEVDNATERVINLDVLQAAASRQKEYDQNIEVGSLYKIGSAQAVCISRTPEDRLFQSMADNDPVEGGQSITAVFEVTEPGTVEVVAADEEEMKLDVWKREGLRNATQRGHIYKIAAANVSFERRAKVVEFSFRSQLGINLSGLCSFRNIRYGNVELVENSDDRGDCPDGWEQDLYGEQFYDTVSCLRWNDTDYNSIDADGAAFERYESDTITTKEKRYSFFRIYYRNAAAGEEVPWKVTDNLYGFCSERTAAVYNWLRIEFPSDQRWSVKFVPVSGWEIRQNIARGDLWVLDSTLQNPVSVSDANLRLHTSGYNVTRTIETFRILTLQPPDGVDVNNGTSDVCKFGTDNDDLEIWFDDETFYGDAWARLAEAFYFNEMTTSANAPEHEIVNVNIITENNPVPDYSKLALVGLNIRSSLEINRLEQFSVYVNEGLGQNLLELDEAVHHFPDVLFDLLTSKRYGVGSMLSRELIDIESFKDAHKFCDDRRYFFDGAITEKINIRTWATETANNYLLDLCISGGRFALKPVVNFYGPEKITGLFTAGNILDDTFKLSYIDQQDRLAPIISVRWREERESGGDNKKGLFPVVREVSVREERTSDLAPVTQIDVTQYCTSLEQAVDRAKYECRYRRLVTHTVAFKTVPSEANVQVGAIIKVGMETVSYNQPYNGAVDGIGRVTMWGDVPTGTQKCLVWDGASRSVSEEELLFDGEFVLNRTNCVFCLANSSNKAEGYKVMKVGFDEDGNVDIEAIYWPLDEQDVSMIVKGWDQDSNWLIEGINYEG